MSVALRHHYRPRGVAAALFDCRAPEVLLSGPAGTGKSRACLEKLHLMALLNPGMRGLIVRKTAVSLGSTGLVTFREHVAKESIAAGDVVWYGGSPQEAAAYRYTNGSVIVVGGMDKATKIMSSGDGADDPARPVTPDQSRPGPQTHLIFRTRVSGSPGRFGVLSVPVGRSPRRCRRRRPQ